MAGVCELTLPLVRQQHPVNPVPAVGLGLKRLKSRQ